MPSGCVKSYANGTLPPRDVSRDIVLATGVRAGDPDALKALFTTYYDELIAYAYSMTLDATAAEDVVQDVFLRIWTRRTEWTAEGEGVARYLYGAVRNRAIDVLRRHRRRGEGPLAVPEPMLAPVGSATLEANELAAVVTRAIDALPARGREVFVLSRSRKLSQREIAELLGIAVNTVNTHLARALQAIRSAVDTFERGGR